MPSPLLNIPVLHPAVPMFLSTKLMPRTETDSVDYRGESELADGRRGQVEAVEHFNDCIDDISSSYQAAADDVLGKLLSSSGSTR